MQLQLPPALARLSAYVKRSERRSRLVEQALGCAYLAGWVGKASATPAELAYTGHPFEVIPFAWQGGDALQFAMLVYDAKLAPRCPIVSFAPGDDGGPVWLGDDADQALGNLMGVALRDAGAEWRTETEAAVREVADALAIVPTKNVRALTRGARSKKRPAPPTGGRWIANVRGMGAWAKQGAFDKKLGDHALPKWPEPGPELERARAALARGFPASALAIARQVYATQYYEDNFVAAAVMRDAYEALGRTFLVARVDAYLRQHAATQKKPKRK